MAGRAHPGAAAGLRRLAPMAGTLAVITGRPAPEAVAVGGLDQVPGLIVLGSYGRQRWEAGRLTAPPAPPGVATARRAPPPVPRAARTPPTPSAGANGHPPAGRTTRNPAPATAPDRPP